MSGVCRSLCDLGSGAFVDGATISDGFCVGAWESVTRPGTSRSKGLGLRLSRELSGNVSVHILGEQRG